MKRIKKLYDDVSWNGGDCTFRRLIKSHCFSAKEIYEIVESNSGAFRIVEVQNPRGGPRSKIVEIIGPIN